MVLELEARLRRLALDQPLLGGAAAGMRGDHSQAEQIAQLIAERYAEPLRVSAIAAAVGLHPHYAMARFRAAMGVSIGTYLTQYRVMHAQRLLATTDASVIAVGLEAGFGSASQFHAAFKQACGCSPGAYRALV